MSYENERRKTEVAIRILLSKVVGKQKTKTDGSNSIFNVVGKRKTKTESQIPFSDDVGKRKTKLEVRIPFSYFAGKRLALRYTHCTRIMKVRESLDRTITGRQRTAERTTNLAPNFKMAALNNILDPEFFPFFSLRRI